MRKCFKMPLSQDYKIKYSYLLINYFCMNSVQTLLADWRSRFKPRLTDYYRNLCVDLSRSTPHPPPIDGNQNHVTHSPPNNNMAEYFRKAQLPKHDEEGAPQFDSIIVFSCSMLSEQGLHFVKYYDNINFVLIRNQKILSFIN